MKILFVSLGCDKNTVDSEVMLGILSREGYEFTDDEEQAEIAVVNSCCFINDAKEESIETIIDLGRRRTEGQLKALIVTGCLAQRYPDEIHKDLPEVDAVVGTAGISGIADVIMSVLDQKSTDCLCPLDKKPFHAKERVMTTGGLYEYLKIAEGCDRHCTYCIIPKIRGPFRSYPIEELVDEASKLVQNGVRELILVAQETTLYGTDLYGCKMLPELLRRLCRIEDLLWIRIMYCYPEEITDELIEVMSKEPKVLHYIDMPVQSGADPILKTMGRHVTRKEILELVQRLREAIPDICLRTTLITGFPSETAADHKDTLELIKQARFDRLGCFKYSPEEGTPAAGMPGQISDRTKSRRLNEIMSLQQEIAFSNNDAINGRVLEA
ncbi:MAG: 30S ribosomal protein S12 methylthiotransferase RimO, partial [Lachnospiraceae bacterium]|nr:30S ribosomal protein S12 methylthiotransferase RimO [Lachnospiraceae bacterium]